MRGRLILPGSAGLFGISVKSPPDFSSFPAADRGGRSVFSPIVFGSAVARGPANRADGLFSSGLISWHRVIFFVRFMEPRPAVPGLVEWIV
jgi:hypothetical protein